MVGYLFVHDGLFSCMVACRLSLWDVCVSLYIQITSLGRLFLIGFLKFIFLGVIPNCFPSSKLGVWIRVQKMGYINIWEHHGEDDYPSKEDFYSPELYFMDTYMASVLFRTLGCVSSCWYNHPTFRTCFCPLFPLKAPYP